MIMNVTRENMVKTWVKRFVVMKSELYPFPSLFYWLNIFVPIDHIWSGQGKMF